MKKSILLSYIALLIAFVLPALALDAAKPEPEQTASPPPAEPAEAAPSETPAAESLRLIEAEAAPKELSLIIDGQAVVTDMQDYLIGVVAAEMPASFHPEALKAQAVAARTYAIYTSKGGKHPQGQLCTDYSCCQAWSSDEKLRENWGQNYESYAEKIRTAVEETEGEYLCYQGQAVFAAFHSSSAGLTENSGALWAQLPYLVSVESPETAEHVPNFVSTVSCSPLDFRDTLLYAHPESDFTGDESTWIGSIQRDDSGRVDSAVLGGTQMKGTELRSLFSLRSTAFELEYTQGQFVFTVTGYGHGVGMSQYGANIMAQQGSGYREILSHYYPGTELAA